MIAVIQRVYNAEVFADGVSCGTIGRGLYILLGVECGDTEEDARLLCDKIYKLRIFSDSLGKMNLSVNDVGGSVMSVSNFTLNANYSHGNRPDYLNSAPPAIAKELYNYFNNALAEKVSKLVTGVFGTDMRTEMSTDGPVTIVMKSEVLKRGKK